MSSTHATIEKNLGVWVIIDQTSKNGTFVAGRRVTKHELHDGDIVELGHTFFLYRSNAGLPRHTSAICSWNELSVAAPLLATFDADLAADLEALARIAISDAPVLLLGASGTGKEVAARAVHTLSKRTGAFVAVNCASIPDKLAEAELFGVRKNAFSGADADRQGLIDSASDGTLFLDEIGELAAPIQAKLLRVLEQRQVRAVGSTAPIDVDFRLVVATNRDLRQEVAADRFRADLYNRVAGFILVLPELRHRRADLGALIGVLLERLAPERANSLELHYTAARRLLSHHWPGNIRELSRCLQTALVLAAGEKITEQHLPQQVRGSSMAAPTVSPEDQRQQLVTLLQAHEGNVAAVARALGTSRTQVHRLGKRLGVDFPVYRPG